jgi:hypothetical protein
MVASPRAVMGGRRGATSPTSRRPITRRPIAVTTALIVYRSRSGTTRRLAEEIGAFVAERGVTPTVVSVGDCDVQRVNEADCTSSSAAGRTGS